MGKLFFRHSLVSAFFLLLIGLSFTISAQQVTNTIQNQLKNAPTDPSFIYESRFIPGNKSKVVIIELPRKEIKDSSSTTTNKEDDKGIHIPDNILENVPKINLTQIIVVGGVIFIFALYRMRMKKRRQK